MHLLLINKVKDVEEVQEVEERGRRDCRPFSFDEGVRDLFSVGGGDVGAEDAKFAGGGADFGEGGSELGCRGGIDVEEKLVFPWAAVDGAALDFQKVDSVSGEGLK